MAKNESTKSKAEVYREERKARIANAAKKNAKSIEKRNSFAKIAKKAVAIILAVAIVGGIAWKTIDELGVIERFATAVTIGDEKISAAQFNYYFSSQYSQMVSQANYYSQTYGYDIGFDTTVPPDEQKTTDAEGNETTWSEVIKDNAVDYAQFVEAYYGEAVANDYKLDEEAQAEVDELIENYRTQAATNNYSLNAFLRQNFGPGFNEKAFTEQITKEYLAENYYSDKQTALADGITDDVIKAEYEANRKKYDYTDIRYYSFTFTTLKGNEGETEEQLKARQKAENDKVIAEAKAVYDKVTNEATLISAVKEYKNKDVEKPSDTDYTTLTKNAQYDAVVTAVSEKGADWAFDAARKVGDKTMITGDKAVYIIVTVNPLYSMNSVDVRHCLIKFDAADENNVTEAEKKAAHAEAKALYDSFMAGDKSEEAFTKLATENTEDEGSAATGGLYEGIRISDSYVEPFEAWSFDPARKAGDCGIIETEYGYHIMYFVSDNTDDLDWKNTIKASKGSEAFTEYQEKLLADDGAYKVTANDTWTNHAANDYCDRIRKNNAYSAAYGA
ncbi:MAG: peptidylprolyl isomerase [Clostridia bacterium]|nr:peptidylprolyl isomerase [Clostridia bacterium]